MAQLRKVDVETAARVSALSKAVGLRNILVHAYAGVDHQLIWGVVQNDLVPLLTQLEELLTDNT